MHSFSGESKLGTIKFAGLEELVKKHATVTLRIAVTRHEASNMAGVFYRDLHELAFAQKAVHARNAFRGGWCLISPLPQQTGASDRSEKQAGGEFHFYIRAWNTRSSLDRYQHSGSYNDMTLPVMRPEANLNNVESTPQTPAIPDPPVLLVTLDPRFRAFLSNVVVWLGPQQAPDPVSSEAGLLWPDVFVKPHIPWGRFVESAILHTAAVFVLWTSAQLWPEPTRIIAPAPLRESEVLYYDASDYLPPLDTGASKPQVAQKGDPAYSAQPIISVPPEPDNRKQTIVAPPKLKLDHDVQLPNVVAWNQTTPSIPLAATNPENSKALPLPLDAVAPPPEVAATQANRAVPLSQSVVSPPPELHSVNSRRANGVSQPVVIDPPPAVVAASARRLGDINIAASQVVAPAPQLPTDAQVAHAGAAGRSIAGQAAVIPPPPSFQDAGRKDGRLIALNMHPVAPSSAITAPAGNRRGTFAATPHGKPGAAGTPDMAGDPKASQNSTSGASKTGWSATGVPPGLIVGAAAKGDPGKGDGSELLARSTVPTLPRSMMRSGSESSQVVPSELERKVFGDRKLYSLTLNTPNLNSAGGSWVMRFAELKEDPQDKGELTAPIATEEVDPGYPLELMRQNVQGTVTLSAVIHSDGHVGEVRILSGVDDRLDQYACEALGRWKFQPAEKNGKPVPLQAVVKIPFRPMKRNGF